MMDIWRRRAAAVAMVGAAAMAVKPACARAQGVTIAPPVVVIDHKTRGGSVDIFNPSRDPVEVSVKLVYGYPVTDSVGAIVLARFDTAAVGEPTAAPWIDLYPKRVTVLPGQRQTVRFFARPPANLADREYWSRIIFSSKAGAIPVLSADSTRISGSINVTIESITTLLYRKGAVQTALAFGPIKPGRSTPDSLPIRIAATPSGNAAWLGTIRGRLVDAAGKTVATFERPVGIYHGIDPEFAFPIRGLPGGSYTVNVDGVSERSDLSRSSVLQTPTAHAQQTVTLPSRSPQPER